MNTKLVSFVKGLLLAVVVLGGSVAVFCFAGNNLFAEKHTPITLEQYLARDYRLTNIERVAPTIDQPAIEAVVVKAPVSVDGSSVGFGVVKTPTGFATVLMTTDVMVGDTLVYKFFETVRSDGFYSQVTFAIKKQNK